MTGIGSALSATAWTPSRQGHEGNDVHVCVCFDFSKKVFLKKSRCHLIILQPFSVARCRMTPWRSGM